MTEPLHFHFSLSCIGKGNGNPFQCSCLQNSRDGRAWWAAVYGVAHSRTQLKRLSSSSSSSRNNKVQDGRPVVFPQTLSLSIHSLKHISMLNDTPTGTMTINIKKWAVAQFLEVPILSPEELEYSSHSQPMKVPTPIKIDNPITWCLECFSCLLRWPTLCLWSVSPP